jgi:hypothetical protein
MKQTLNAEHSMSNAQFRMWGKLGVGRWAFGARRLLLV